MINWAYFPKNKKCDEVSLKVIEAFKSVEKTIDSENHQYKSDEVLQRVRPELEKVGFLVEKGKKTDQKVVVPVLFGKNGTPEKTFEVDGYYPQYKYVIEVEASRAVNDYHFLKDFFEAVSMVDVDYLCIAVRNKYRIKDFDEVCRFFDTMYVSGRLGIPLSGILIIGY